MFDGATAFNSDLSDWDVSNVTNMRNMFDSATSFDQDLSSWNVSNVTNMTNMFNGVTLSTANYDALLVGWNNLTLQSGISFHGGDSICTQGSIAETARSNMISSDGWVITDGGCKLTQTITFTNPGNKTVGDTFTLGATADSGLSVSYTSSVCTVSASTGDVTLVTVGNCSITASQAGDASYAAATDVSQSFTVTEDVVPTTTASTPSYKLTITQPSGGSISGEGISCGSDCQQYFDRGTTVPLTATPTSTWIFNSWSGDCESDGTIIMKNDSSCSATFAKQYTLTLTTEGQGTIEDCGTECTQTHLDGETVSLNAIPAEGWVFSELTGDCDSTGQVLIDGDKYCTANFLKQYTLTLNTAGEGTIEACGTECTQISVDGETVSLVALPADGWNLNSWSGDCDNTGQVLIDSDKSCTATFLQETRLNVTTDEHGTITGEDIDCGTDCTQTYPPDTSVTLTAIPEADFIFTGWAGDCVGTEPTTTLTLEINKSCIATFGPPCIDTQRLYVNQTATSNQTGCEWPNAFHDLQAALAPIAEGTLTSVTEIWVAKGTYKPTTNTDRNATFQLQNGVAIYGGFAGTETQLSERNATLNQTILSGDIGVVGDNSDNSYHVITGQNLEATTIINGVVISSGNANGDGNNACGGGIFNTNSNPTMDYLLFENNSATYGGGLCNRNGSHPAVSYGFFKNNSAQDGGGIYNELQSHPVISHVFLQSNTASRQGGGLFNQAGSNPILGHVNISGNTAVQGGGIANNNSSPKISHSIFSGNQATNGGGMVNLNQSSPLLSHVIINGNSATQTGGALLNQNSTPTLSQTTITENLAQTGSGIVNQSSQTTINNSIIWENHPLGGIAGAQISDDANSQTTVNYSIIQGGRTGEGNKNEDPLFAEPVVDNITTHTTVGDFHLSENSPAIDAGNNALILPDFADAECAGILGDGNTTEIVEIDFDGKPRLEDGNGDGTAIVDMGAYEAPTIVLPNYPLTVSLTGEGSGTVNSNKAGITCGTDCSQDYQSGLKVLLIAQAEAGSNFSGWSGACSGTEDDIMLEMTEAKNCQAQFEPISQKRFALPSITLICEDCNINQAALVDPEAQPVEPGNYAFPQGLVSFELTQLENPSVHLDIYYHNTLELDNFVYRKYGTTIAGDGSSADWYTFSNVSLALGTLDGQTMVKASLTLTDGALGDNTGVDGRIVDPGGIALEVAEEESTSEVVEDEPTSEVVEDESTSEVVENEPTLEEENATSQVSEEEALLDSTVTQEEILSTFTQESTIAHCEVIGGKATNICDVEQQIFPIDINVGETASISHALFEANVENQGLISNSIIEENATLTGGKLTGNITNQGTITDIEFVGAKLSGGTLSGTIVNNSKIGGAIENVQLTSGTTLSGGKVRGTIKNASDSTLENVQLVAGTTVRGGILSGEITGDSDKPPLITAAEIAPGTILSDVRLSPSVELPDDVVLGPGVILPSEPPTIEDFGLEIADLANLEDEPLGELEAEVFAVMTPEQLAIIPPAALKALQPAQIAKIQRNTLSALTVKQFNSVPIKTLSGLTAANMGGFSTDVLNQFTPQHISALQRQAFKQMPSEEISKFFVYLDAKKISVSDVLPLMPEGWQIDANTGAITAPEGMKLTPRILPASDKVSVRVKLPQVFDIDKSLGLGGQGTSIKDNMEVYLNNRSLENEDLTDFELSQNPDTGFLIVEGTDESKGINYSFIPDIDNVIQVDGDKIPIGLSIIEGGFYIVTTSDEKQYKVIPAPKDPVALSEVLDGGEVVIGKRGDVMMEMPESETSKRGKPRQVAMFAPVIEPAPDDLCVEITPGETVCDFDNAPASQQPGLHLEDNTHTTYKNQPQGKIVYPDGTAQLITPTLLSPEVFTDLGFEYEGVEDIVFNSNGTFYVLYQGQPYLIVPKFEVVTEEVIEGDEPLKPGIVLNKDATLTYTIMIDDEETNTRKRGKPRQVMTFKPEIQIVPDDLCVEIAPGEIVCDFE